MAHSERYFNGAYLRLVRKRHQVTQQELAQTLAVSRQMISVWESGKTEMSETMLSRLAQALGEDFGELLERYYGEPAEEGLAQDNGEEVARTQFEMIYEGVGLNEGGTIGGKMAQAASRVPHGHRDGDRDARRLRAALYRARRIRGAKPDAGGRYVGRDAVL